MPLPRLPAFITFTGLDARTDLTRAFRLAQVYPIEFGVLFSPKRQGLEPRYPDGDTQSSIWWSPLAGNGGGNLGHIAAHLCGQYGRDIMTGASPNVPVDLVYCRRVQVNHLEPDPRVIGRYVSGWGRRLHGIAQTRGDSFPPPARRCDWLFDRSGGTGQQPAAWPRHPGGNQLVGFAGGIGPDNVLKTLRQIDSAGPFWIDMESGVRTDDWLDLDKVEAVCLAVYGNVRVGQAAN